MLATDTGAATTSIAAGSTLDPRRRDQLEPFMQTCSSTASAATAAATGVIPGRPPAPDGPAVETIPAAAFTAGETPMPWGSPVTEDRNCRESVGNGAYTFGKDLVQGAGQLILGYNPESGDWFSGGAYGQAWGGLGDLVGSIVVLASPVGWVAAGMAATGNNDNGWRGRR